MSIDKETLLRWKEAGVLIDIELIIGTPDCWDGPHTIKDVGILMHRKIRPYRAPGHIQPHDGSHVPPERVKPDDRVIPCVGRRWTKEKHALEIHWSSITFYIVLPRITP
jgi:hypothetical protein